MSIVLRQRVGLDDLWISLPALFLYASMIVNYTQFHICKLRKSVRKITCSPSMPPPPSVSCMNSSVGNWALLKFRHYSQKTKEV